MNLPNLSGPGHRYEPVEGGSALLDDLYAKVGPKSTVEDFQRAGEDGEVDLGSRVTNPATLIDRAGRGAAFGALGGLGASGAARMGQEALAKKLLTTYLKPSKALGLFTGSPTPKPIINGLITALSSKTPRNVGMLAGGATALAGALTAGGNTSEAVHTKMVPRFDDLRVGSEVEMQQPEGTSQEIPTTIDEVLASKTSMGGNLAASMNPVMAAARAGMRIPGDTSQIRASIELSDEKEAAEIQRITQRKELEEQINARAKQIRNKQRAAHDVLMELAHDNVARSRIEAKLRSDVSGDSSIEEDLLGVFGSTPEGSSEEDPEALQTSAKSSAMTTPMGNIDAGLVGLQAGDDPFEERYLETRDPTGKDRARRAQWGALGGALGGGALGGALQAASLPLMRKTDHIGHTPPCTRVAQIKSTFFRLRYPCRCNRGWSLSCCSAYPSHPSVRHRHR